MSLKLKRLSEKDFKKFVSYCVWYADKLGISTELFFDFDELDDGVFANFSIDIGSDTAIIILNKDIYVSDRHIEAELKRTAFHEVVEILIISTIDKLKVLHDTKVRDDGHNVLEDSLMHSLIHKLWRLYGEKK